MKPFISLCMIVKNEEKVLQRCLDSVKGIVDEIVIADTGSTDRTKEIARRYTDKVYDFEWTDSFADARNFAQSKAEGEWILVMDADEFVDRENLKAVVEGLRNDNTPVEAFFCKIYNFTGYQGEQIVQHHSLRIYKNLPSIRYFRTIHEQLDKEGDGELQAGISDLIIYHSGYLASMIREKKKSDRNNRLIKKQIIQSGNGAFDYFNMGNEYLVTGQVEKALDAYKKAYLGKKDIRYSWVPFCVVQIVQCLMRLQRYGEALKVIKDAEAIWENAADFPCMRGQIYWAQHRLDDAKEEFMKILSNKGQYQSSIKSIDMQEFFPYQFLGNIYELQQDYQKAVYYYTNALNVNPRSQETLYSLLSILAKFHPPEEVRSLLDKMGWNDNFQKRLILVKILLNLAQWDLAKKYIERLDERPEVKEGFLIKLDLAKGEFARSHEAIKGSSLQQLIDWIRIGCFDLCDLVLQGFVLGDTSFILLIQNLVSGKDVKNFIRFILDGESRVKCKTDYYLQLMERCLQYRQFETFERLLDKKSAFGKKIDLNLGHLLYRYDFTDIAIAFYQEIKQISLYDSQAYINIIEAFLNAGDPDSALQFALLALEKKHFDFRIFKHAIEILGQKGLQEDRNALIQIALEHYPDSRFLRSKQMSDIRLNILSHLSDIENK